MSRLKLFFLTLTCAVAAATLVEAQSSMTIRLATVVPDKSAWGDSLREFADSLKRGTANRVTLHIAPGGQQGSEKAVVDRMLGGSIDASLLTVNGLSLIDDSFNVFALPFFYESPAEVRHVQEKLTPVIAAKLQAKGFHLLSWGDGGWVQLFSKKPLKTVSDLRKVKLFTSEGNDKMVQWYKSNGFNPVAMPDSEIIKQLKSLNGVEAVPMPAYAAQLTNVYRDAPYMLEIQVAPLVGALVFTTQDWNKISEVDRKAITTAAAAMQKQLETRVPAEDKKSVAFMQTEGYDLKVTKLDPKAAAEFRVEAEKLTATVTGSIVPRDVFEAALRERDAYRKSNPVKR